GQRERLLSSELGSVRRIQPRPSTSGALSSSGGSPAKYAHRSPKCSRHSQGSSNQRATVHASCPYADASSRSTPRRKRTSTRKTGMPTCHPLASWMGRIHSLPLRRSSRALSYHVAERSAPGEKAKPEARCPQR